MYSMRMGRVAQAALVVVLLPLAGCFRTSVQAGRGAPNGTVVYEQWQHFWIGGLVGDTRVNVNELCPSGDATVESKQSFLNGLVGGLTGGIYVPMTIKVRCRGGRGGDLRLSAEDARRISEDPAFEGWVRAEFPERLQEVQQALADR